ncbi:MAG TPA: flavodoxin family protein [Candidatus Bathyarchaeia archaeon]|nr:flavodoxin family protein [Candidatus Bathyarchaeia archaeon]
MEVESKQKAKLFGISGSPRRAATDWIIKEALRYAEERWNVETRYFSVRGKKLNFCIHCDHCIKEGGCVHDDAMTEVYSGFEWADAVLIGTPVYQGTLSGQAKVVLDRMRAFAASNPQALKEKVGAAVADGGDRIGGQELAIRAITDFYVINEMIHVGGGAFGANLGATFWSKDKGVAGVKADKEGLKSLYKTVDRLMAVCAMIKGDEEI